jgi:GDP-4-dehydro-6-deoxy-D-mannose reductase
MVLLRVDGSHVDPRRIMLTGANGFAGGYMRSALRTAFPDAELIATGRASAPGLVNLDVTDHTSVAELLRATKPDVVIHLAAIALPAEARKHPGLAWRVNLHGSLSIAEAAQVEAPGCMLLFVSSSEVYGRSFGTGRPLDEMALLAPNTVYAATKAAADLALGAMAGDCLRILRFRPFNHTGPGQSPDYVVASFARQVARVALGLQPPVIRVGSLDAIRDFLDVRDVCAAYIAGIRRAGDLPADCIVNIASGTARRISDVLEQLIRIADVHAKIEVDESLVRPNEIASATGDASRAEALLGWRPLVPWEVTLGDMLADAQRRARSGC